MEDRIRAVHRSLVDEHGDPGSPREIDPLVALVGTILSQNTTDDNRDRALDRIEDRIGLDPEAIHAADRGELEAAIRPAGLQSQKAERVHALLDRLREETGGYDLGFLGELSTEEARDWLTGVPGIGPKTAAVELLFRFDKPLFPVDTHCERVGKRLGLIPPDAGYRAAHAWANEHVPDELKYPLHRLLITHGREVCTARDPDCADSPTCRRFCAYLEHVIEGDADPDEEPFPTEAGRARSR